MQVRAPASSFSSSRNMEKPPQKTYRLLCYELRCNRSSCRGPRLCIWRQEQPPSTRTHVHLPPHPHPARQTGKNASEQDLLASPSASPPASLFSTSQATLGDLAGPGDATSPPRLRHRSASCRDGSAGQRRGTVAPRGRVGAGAELCGPPSHCRDAPPLAALSESWPAATASIILPDAMYEADVLSSCSIDSNHFLSGAQAWGAAPGPTTTQVRHPSTQSLRLRSLGRLSSGGGRCAMLNQKQQNTLFLNMSCTDGF